jgi:hypothetical protein
MLATPSEDWHLFSDWADDIFKIFEWNAVNDEPDILRAWRALRLPAGAMRLPMTCCPT